MADVVVTGLGVWCSLGRGTETVARNLRAGSNALKPVPAARFDTRDPGYRSDRACLIPEADFHELHRSDPTVVKDFAHQVLVDALVDGGLSPSVPELCDTGLVFGTTGAGAIALTSHYRARLGKRPGDLRAIVGPSSPGTIVGRLATELGLGGPTAAVSTACSAGANAIGRAFDLVRLGYTDRMLAGGADVVSEMSFSGFNALQALSRGTCRPFHDDRDGLVLGDASAFVLLESAAAAAGRGARPYARISGYAIGNEAYHSTRPDPSGVPAARVMRQALAQAGLTPGDVDHINTHGTATVPNDLMEARAVRRLLDGRRTGVSVSATKSLTGHTLGAAGSLEAVLMILALHLGFPPSGVGPANRVTEFEDVFAAPPDDVSTPPTVVLSNSFGFGGNLASLVLRSADNLLTEGCPHV